MWKAVSYLLAWMTGTRTCRAHGCGHEQFGNDDRCAICRHKL